MERKDLVCYFLLETCIGLVVIMRRESLCIFDHGVEIFQNFGVFVRFEVCVILNVLYLGLVHDDIIVSFFCYL